MIGSDISGNLLKICQKKSADVFVADSLNLPIKTGSLDHCISIAVIHHFSTGAKRVRAIEEIVRVTKKGGRCLLYVWAMEQDERKFGQQDIFVPWNLQKKYDDKNKKQ
jgi:ubiquinone/menaquinone biosynthesis C-methylase UbiE